MTARDVAHLLRRTALLVAAVLLVAPGSGAAQSNTARPVGIEWAGGSAGSALGIGAMLLVAHPGDCPDENVGCVIERLGLIALGTAVTAPLGAWSAGEMAGTHPSALGAAVGGVLGAAAGVGAMRLLSELGVEPKGIAAVVIYTVTQGLVTAAGSRIGAAASD